MPLSKTMADRNKGSLQCQVFLRMHPNPFMDKVGIEVVDQGDMIIEVSGGAHSAMTGP